MERNLRLYPWYQAARNLLFWQAIWFLYFEQVLTAEEAILLAATYDLGSVLLEVPSGYFSDRFGRRITLLISTIAAVASYLLFFSGSTFAIFVIAQLLWSITSAFNSGTDSALLYDSLQTLGRQKETAAAEAKAWRYSYVALAVSAALGGIIATVSGPHGYALTYLVTALAGTATLVIAYLFSDPPQTDTQDRAAAPMAQFATIVTRLQDPVLRWMFVFMVSMYILSHVPFVFVQPYLRELLSDFGLQHETPAVAGLIVALMMAISAVLGWFVLSLRDHFGTKALFGIALVLQTGLIGVMAWVVHPLIIGFILLRMVPGALTRPFFLEAIQPRLESGYRATYLSMQSLVARLVFSATLFGVAAAVAGTETLDRTGLTQVLPWFMVAGALISICLWRFWPDTLSSASTSPVHSSSDT